MTDALTATWPYLLELAAYLGLRFWVLGFISRPAYGSQMTAMEAALTIPSAIGSYAMLLVMPWLAGPAYPLDIVRSASYPTFYLSAVGLLAMCGAAVMLLWRDPRRRLHLFCAAWILITLAPMLNLRGLFPETLVQDRYLYLPSFGFCLIAADLVVTFGRGSEKRTRAAWIAMVAVMLIFAALTFHMQRFWHDDVALFERGAEQAPEVEFWHYWLGLALEERKDLEGARRELIKATALAPADARGFYDLSLVDEKLGDLPAAEHAMAQWLRVSNHPPLGGYAKLALIADAAGDPAGSEAALAKAATMPGGVGVAAVVRAQIRYLHGDRSGAEQALREVLRRDPNNAQAQSLIAAIKRGAMPR